MAVDYDRRTDPTHQDYIDRAPNYDASGWGVLFGVAALLAILGMLFIGMGNTPPSTSPQTTIERTAPTPAPTQPAVPAPTPAPN